MLVSVLHGYDHETIVTDVTRPLRFAVPRPVAIATEVSFGEFKLTSGLVSETPHGGLAGLGVKKHDGVNEKISLDFAVVASPHRLFPECSMGGDSRAG